MAGSRREPPMKDRWRSEEKHGNRDHYSSRNRSRSPISKRGGPSAGGRPASSRDNHLPRPGRKRSHSPEGRRPPPRRPSVSPARSPRLPPPRHRYPADSAFGSREPSPVRFPKRRRTRSPSPSNWSDRDFADRRRYSRSRSRDRYDPRDPGPPGPSYRRPFSPRRPSPRANRPVSRGIAPEIDSYIPERRRPDTPPRRLQRRSPSPRRSLTPPLRRRSRSPPPRRFPSRPGSPSSHYNSPYPSRRGRGRDATPEVQRGRRKPHSRTPSIARDLDQESMDGPYAFRGQHGNPNYMPRGRGHRPYNNNRGSFRGTPVAGSPNASHYGSPHSNASYHGGGRGGWDSPRQQFSPPGQHMPPLRQNSFGGPAQSQEEYFRTQQPQGHHPYPNPPQRPFRGGRSQQRGAPFPQHGQDRRFSGPDPNETPTAPRGRGAHYNNAQWTAGAKRGAPTNQTATGPNSIRASPALSHRASRDTLPPQDESPTFQPPKGPQADDAARQDYGSSQQQQQNLQSQKDASKFSFAFKSKPPPQSPARPPSDLTLKVKPPPTRPASDRPASDRPPGDRPPPTQPKANRFHDKRTQHQNAISERRDDCGPGRPPNRPQQHPERLKQPPTEPKARSRSPPAKRVKQEPRPKPKMTPEMAVSESIYYRKPGNESVVGAGTYGKVFKAVHIYTKDEAALKKIRMEGERDGFPITAVREIKLLQNLRHQHVVALQETMVEKNECFMVFEYMAHDLTGLINHPTFRLTAAHKKDLGRQMFEGLEFLHRRGVMHRDIKAANLLISAEGQLKYADFGLARFYAKSRKQDYTNRVITIWYRPPELLLGETQYGPAVDIWSAACVFMEMFTRKAIFPGEGGELSQLEKIYNVLGIPTTKEWAGIVDMPWYELMQPAVTAASASSSKDKQDRDTKPGQRTFEANYSSLLSSAALDLVTQIFSYDPAARPDAARILEHGYFTSEEPAPQQPYELAEVAGEWHEYESKAHRREHDRKEKEKRRDEYVKEREKRKAKEAGLDGGKEGSKKMKGYSANAARIEEAPAAPLPAGEEDGMSDGEGSARMSMS